MNDEELKEIMNQLGEAISLFETGTTHRKDKDYSLEQLKEAAKRASYRVHDLSDKNLYYATWAWAKELYPLIYEHFKDHDKAFLWFETDNPLLGDKCPIEMIFIGRGQKLRDFIATSLDENKR